MKTAFRVTTIVLGLVILFSSIPFSTFAAQNTYETIGTLDLPIWDGSISNSFSGGNGTSSSPYIITKGSDLAFLAQRVDSGGTYSGTYFVIENDIILNDYSDWESWDKNFKPNNIFNAIGNSDKDFRGHIDGRGHSIYGLYTNDGGLIYELYYGSVKNLGLEASYVSGNSSAGGLICQEYGTVENCYNKARVEGSQNVGGICGYVSGTVKNCLTKDMFQVHHMLVEFLERVGLRQLNQI